MFGRELSEALGLVATIDPQLVDNATVTSDLVSMSECRRLLFVVTVGATDTTVDAKLREATDASGSDEQDLDGKAITQLGATDDNKQVLLEVTDEELSAGYTHVSLDVTVGNGSTGADVAAVGLAGVPRSYPASDLDLASVAEIVV